MTDHSKRVCAILEAAVELPRDQLSTFLERACGSDVALRGEIEELLHFLASAPTHFLEPPAPPDPDSESQLGEFVLLHKLGQGGMGVVYLARQESLGREVAVKVLTVGPGTPASFVERFHRESRAAAKLNHDGIARVFVDGRDGVDHWFAMEFVPGHDLSRELDLQRGRENGVPILPDPSDPEHGPSVARLVAGVADALAYAHCRGIIHRDIKPQNLLLTPDGVVKVADFGLARDQSLDSLTRGEVMGSVHYMSPERLGDEGSFDHRADVYSLGVVLYEMLTLDRPFEGRTTDDVILKIREQEPRSVRARNPRVSRDLAVLCHKAMSKDPERRFADAGLLASELRRVAAGLPIETRPPSMSERAGRWAWRHRVLLGAGAVFGVALWVLWFFVLRPPTAVMSLEGAGIAGARASVYPIKPVGWVVGERREIGLCPCEVDLPLGYYRFVLKSERGFAELTRWLATPGQRYVAGDHVRLRPSDEVRDGMAEVAGGSFMFGWEGAKNIDHRPRAQRVEPFWIDKTEVSNGDYRKFLADTEHPAPALWPAGIWKPEWDDLPVAGVSHGDACSYAEWAGKRLASDREWERAARGTDGWLLPWRPDLDRDDVLARAVVERGPFIEAGEAGGWASYLAGVESVTSRDAGRNRLGMYHLVGNVQEWTETVATSVVDGRVVASHGNYRAKGCDFSDGEVAWPLPRTYWTPATVTEDRYGFRCAKSARP